MIQYKLIPGGVYDNISCMSIPENISNRHWLKYLDWVKEGNTPEPEVSDEEIKQKETLKIKADFQKSLSIPIVVVINDSIIPVQCDEQSQLAVYKLLQLQVPVVFRDAENVMHNLSHKEMHEVASAMFNHVQELTIDKFNKIDDLNKVNEALPVEENPKPKRKKKS